MDIIKNLKEMREYHQMKVEEFTGAMRNPDRGKRTDENHYRRGIHESFVAACDKAIEAISGKTE